MTILDNDNDNYVLPKAPSNNGSENFEDETFELIMRLIHNTGHKVARNPAHKPEAKAKLPPVTATAAAANPLPAAAPSLLLPVDVGAPDQNS